MEILNMSTKEINRLEVIQKVNDKRMSQKEAGATLNSHGFTLRARCHRFTQIWPTPKQRVGQICDR